MNKQNFLNFEGTNFYNRNKSYFNASNDFILNNFDINNHSDKTILEVGCSNGWRLNEFNKFNNKNKYIGLEPSLDAIQDNIFENIKILHGTCDKINLLDDSVDILLIPFVFMYVDRTLLFKSISEIDRVLKNGGLLIITDFYSNRQRKNSYKHIPGSFIYKQNYFEIFTSSKNYFLKKLECFTHNSTNNLDNYDDTCFYAELIKDNENLFV